MVTTESDDSQPTGESLQETLAVLGLHGLSKMDAGLRRLPFSDLMRDHDGFFDVRMMNRSSGDTGLDAL